jgi:putative membrane protein
MKFVARLGLLLGLAILSFIFVWQGVAPVIRNLGHAGFALALVCLLELPNLLMWSEAWRRLFPRSRRPRVIDAFLASSMGESVNSLLPVGSVGGEVVKARVLTLWSYPATDAVSSLVVNKTVQALAVLVWGLIGTAMLAVVVPDREVLLASILGAALLAAAIGGFVGVQLTGGFSVLARVAKRIIGHGRSRRLQDSAGKLDAAVRDTYRRPGDVVVAVAILVTAQVLLASEIVIAGSLMGQPIGISEAILLKGIVTAIRGISFAVPAGLGVQEIGYIGLGKLLGLPEELMLAVSLATRIREVVPSIPFLIAWQRMEGRALLRGTSS